MMSTSCCVEVSGSWTLIKARTKSQVILIIYDEHRNPSCEERKNFIKVTFNKRCVWNLDNFPITSSTRRDLVKSMVEVANQRCDKEALFINTYACDILPILIM